MTEWTVATLKEHIDTRLSEKEVALQAALLAQEKAVAAALESADKAINKAEINAEKWRENANEWRGAMDDRERVLYSRREGDALGARMSRAERFQATLTGGMILLGAIGVANLVKVWTG